MKLYFSPGACSLSPHIVLREAGVDFALERVDLGRKVTASGADFWAINPKGYVPALQLDDGEVITEGPAIVQFVADRHHDARLAPANGTMERVRLQEWLTFIGTEIHKNFSPLFDRSLADEVKAKFKERIFKRVELVEKALAGKSYLLGEFSVADAYLFTCLRWSAFMAMDLAPYANVTAFMARMNERPAVKAALEAEKG
jgi:glutathione S-transferase